MMTQCLHLIVKLYKTLACYRLPPFLTREIASFELSQIVGRIYFLVTVRLRPYMPSDYCIEAILSS